ncbi:MAG: hypothetical protein AABZ35_02445, partial [Gemmatimonadota bacterium]
MARGAIDGLPHAAVAVQAERHPDPDQWPPRRARGERNVAVAVVAAQRRNSDVSAVSVEDVRREPEKLCESQWALLFDVRRHPGCLGTRALRR